jgi:spindle assembly abnormal protein 6
VNKSLKFTIMEVIGHAVDQFDISSATTVFWDRVPVLMQRADREDTVDELSIRLLSGNTKRSVNLKVLHMHIFKESDLLFLHTLEVTEDDFQTLKAEQGILVDFSNFSGKIIDLLKRCIASKGEETPRFRAVLTMSAGESLFKMVETNDFKQLAHIGLCFRPGSDMAIKSFLAFRLTEVQQERENLSRDLSSTKEALQHAQQEASQLDCKLKKVEATHTKVTLEHEAAAKDASSRMLEAHMLERQQLTTGFEECALISRQIVHAFQNARTV